MHKKNLPPERNGSNLFLIYPTSHSLHWCHASLSVTQPSLPCSLRMYAETEQHCFYILLSGGFAWPSHPFALPQPHLLYTHTHTSTHTHPPPLPFYLLRLPQADAVISLAFNRLSHPLASPFFKSCLPLLFWMHSLRFPIPAGRRSRGCQTREGGGNQHRGHNNGRKERVSR